MKQKGILKNESGNILIITIVLSAVLAGLVISGSQVLSSVQKDRLYRKEKDASEYAAAQVTALLQDQRFCSALFNGGYAGTAPGNHSFSSSKFPSGLLRNQVAELEENLKREHNFRIESIQLSNLQPNNSTERLKIFDVTVNLESVLQTNKHSILKKISIGSERKVNGSRIESQRMFLTLGENTGKCTLQKGIQSSIAVHSQKISCQALGGNFDTVTGNCRMQKFKVDVVSAGPGGKYKIEQITRTQETSPNNFTDAICQMELNLLRKDRASGSNYKPNNEFAWTQFCQKPQWSGCYYNGQNIQNGVEVPGVNEYQAKAKSVSNWTKEQVLQTIELRANRIVGPGMNSIKDQANVGINLKKMPSKGDLMFAAIGGGLPAIAMFGDAQSTVFASVVTLAALPIFGPFSPIVAVMLMPACNKARAIVTRVCRDGQMEIKNVRIETQKLKRFKCKWKGGTTVPVPDEMEIATMITNANGRLPAGMSVPVSNLDTEEKSIIAEINSMRSLQDVIASLNDNDGAEDISDMEPPDTRGLSKEDAAKLLDEYYRTLKSTDRIKQALKNKEASLVNGFNNEAANLIREYNGVKRDLQSIPAISQEPEDVERRSMLQNSLYNLETRLRNQRSLGESYYNTVAPTMASNADRKGWAQSVKSQVNSISETLGNPGQKI